MDSILLAETGRMSVIDAGVRADAYVQGVLNGLDRRNFADPEMTIDQFVSALRSQFYDFLMAHYELVDEETPSNMGFRPN